MKITMKELKAYQCGFCSKYGKQKSRILKHEQTCYHNPKTKSCATCIHLHQRSYHPDLNVVLNYYDNRLLESIPVCDEGVDVSSMIDGEKKVYLKTNCALWENVNAKLRLH